MRVIPLNRLENHWTAYLLILLPLGLVLLFNYFPIINGFVHIFYRWDGDRVTSVPSSILPYFYF